MLQKARTVKAVRRKKIKKFMSPPQWPLSSGLKASGDMKLGMRARKSGNAISQQISCRYGYKRRERGS